MTPGDIVGFVIVYFIVGFCATLYWAEIEDGDRAESVAVLFFWPLCLVLYVGKCLWVWLKNWWRSE